VSPGTALAIHPGALGDVLLTIPALRALRDAGARVVMAAQSRLAALLVAVGEADEACDFESLRLDALFAGERGARLPAAERVVCWFGARDADFTRRLAGMRPRVTVAPSTSAGQDVWKHLLATLGGPALGERPLAEPVVCARRDPVRVGDALRVAGDAALRASGIDAARRFVVVHPGAGSPAKCWPTGGFADALAATAARGDVQVLVHQGPADAEPVARLRDRLPAARLLCEPALPILAGVLARCAAYVGNDSGVSHLAAAVGAPSIVLFAEANLAWRPWLPGVTVLAVTLGRVDAADLSAVRRALETALG
jgi:ADP-heptose:LPS heptosyltransferase